MKILVGLSGGLDSTYAAYLLKTQGHEVWGAAVVMHEYSDISGAEEVAKMLQIPFLTLDRQVDFQEIVVSDFLSEYEHGRTPNPCVICNPKVKFGALCTYAEENGFDRVATGHYAYVQKEDGGRYYIRRSDCTKDQSYVLWQLSQKQLGLLMFPLSGMDKAKIREDAARLGFRAAVAKESQEICFIPDNDYIGFIERYGGKTFPSGNFIDDEGKILGRHGGLIRYTVGQRKGLGIALGQPMFVKSLNVDDNTVTLVPSGGEYVNGMRVEQLSFMKMQPCQSGSVRAKVQVRYRATPVTASVRFNDTGADVIFDQPVRAVTPGQSAVFFEEDDLLFGGRIAGH